MFLLVLAHPGKGRKTIVVVVVAYSKYKHVFANILCSRYVTIATKPVSQLQICPIVHN